MKTAIVLGATGLVGRNLVHILSQSPDIDRIIAITRRATEFELPKVSILITLITLKSQLRGICYFHA